MVGEGIHICVACPKHQFLNTFYSNMPLYIPDTILPIQKKKSFKMNYVDFYFLQRLIFHFPLLGRPRALVTISPPGQSSEGAVKNDTLICTSLSINLSWF